MQSSREKGGRGRNTVDICVVLGGDRDIGPDNGVIQPHNQCYRTYFPCGYTVDGLVPQKTAGNYLGIPAFSFCTSQVDATSHYIKMRGFG